MKSVSVDAPGCQFNGERNAVELAADCHDDCGIRIIEIQTRARCFSAFQEWQCRRKVLRDRRGDRALPRRQGQRLQSVNLIAVRLEGPGARGKDLDRAAKGM